MLGGIIAASDDDGLIDCGLKTDAIKAIAFLTMAFPKLVCKYEWRVNLIKIKIIILRPRN